MILNCLFNVSALNTRFRWSAIRRYNPQTLVNMADIRSRERAKSLQLSERKPKTFKPALDHFRLTRFGWEHRKAGSEGERKRKRSHRASVLASRIGYVNPRDYKMMRIYFPHMLLRPRQAPVDTNPNLRPERRILNRHIG